MILEISGYLKLAYFMWGGHVGWRDRDELATWSGIEMSWLYWRVIEIQGTVIHQYWGILAT